MPQELFDPRTLKYWGTRSISLSQNSRKWSVEKMSKSERVCNSEFFFRRSRKLSKWEKPMNVLLLRLRRKHWDYFGEIPQLIRRCDVTDLFIHFFLQYYLPLAMTRWVRSTIQVALSTVLAVFTVDKLKSIKKFQKYNWKCRDSNPGQLGEKCER